MKVKVGFLSKVPLSGHVLVVGPSGAGKTNTVKVLVEELSKSLRVLVLDYHGEYRGLGERYVPGYNLSFNMLSGASDPEFIVDIIGTVFQLTEPQWYLMLKCLKNAGEQITLSSLIAAIEDEPVSDWRTYEVKQAVLRRLTILNEGVLGRVLNGSEPPSHLFEKNSVVDLSVIPPRYRSLLSLVIMKHLYDYATRRGVRANAVHVTVLEEAWSVLLPRARWEQPSIGERLFLELRKYGEMLIAVAQRLDDVSDRVRDNCETVILLRPSTSELEKLGCSRYELQGVELRRLQQRGKALLVKPGCALKVLRVRKARI